MEQLGLLFNVKWSLLICSSCNNCLEIESVHWHKKRCNSVAGLSKEQCDSLLECDFYVQTQTAESLYETKIRIGKLFIEAYDKCEPLQPVQGVLFRSNAYGCGICHYFCLHIKTIQRHYKSCHHQTYQDGGYRERFNVQKLSDNKSFSYYPVAYSVSEENTSSEVYTKLTKALKELTSVTSDPGFEDRNQTHIDTFESISKGNATFQRVGYNRCISLVKIGPSNFEKRLVKLTEYYFDVSTKLISHTSMPLRREIMKKESENERKFLTALQTDKATHDYVVYSARFVLMLLMILEEPDKYSNLIELDVSSFYCSSDLIMLLNSEDNVECETSLKIYHEFLIQVVSYEYDIRRYNEFQTFTSMFHMCANCKENKRFAISNLTTQMAKIQRFVRHVALLELKGIGTVSCGTATEEVMRWVSAKSMNCFNVNKELLNLFTALSNRTNRLPNIQGKILQGKILPFTLKVLEKKAQI